MNLSFPLGVVSCTFHSSFTYFDEEEGTFLVASFTQNTNTCSVSLRYVSSLGIYTHFWLDKNFDWQLSNPVFPKDRSADHLWSAKILELVLGKLFWTHNMLKNDSKHHFLVKFWSAEWLCGPREKKFWILWSATWKSLGNTALGSNACVNCVWQLVFMVSKVPYNLIFLLSLDWNELFTTKCVSCGFPIEAGDRWVEALNNNYHSQCFNCTVRFPYFFNFTVTLVRSILYTFGVGDVILYTFKP